MNSEHSYEVIFMYYVHMLQLFVLFDLFMYHVYFHLFGFSYSSFQVI